MSELKTNKVRVGGINYEIEDTKARELLKTLTGNSGESIDGKINSAVEEIREDMYVKPENGIPKEDLSQVVQDILDLGAEIPEIRENVLDNIDAINVEISTARNNEKTLQDNIDKEVTRAKEAEQELSEKIDNVVTATPVTWDSESDMNNFKEAGVYEIYGERTRQNDNLPIYNASTGHSISARLTVIDSSLRKTDGTDPTEICITQFLMLSNRKGGDGNLYVRTYNENNSPARDWWTPWQKLQGVKEGYIYTDTIQINPDGGVQQVEGVTGMCNMVDNGIYTGIYVNNTNLIQTTVLETFTLIVINDYAAVGTANQKFGQDTLTRQISQLKYATDAVTGTSFIKKRTFKGNGDGYKNPTNWSNWEDIASGVKAIFGGYDANGLDKGTVFVGKDNYLFIGTADTNKIGGVQLGDIIGDGDYYIPLSGYRSGEAGIKYQSDSFSKYNNTLSLNLSTSNIPSDHIVLSDGNEDYGVGFKINTETGLVSYKDDKIDYGRNSRLKLNIQKSTDNNYVGLSTNSEGKFGLGVSLGSGLERGDLVGNDGIYLSSATPESIGGIELGFKGEDSKIPLEVDSHGKAYVELPSDIITSGPTVEEIEDIEENLAATALRKTEQVLTEEEKAQVRANLGINELIEESITNVLNTEV